MSAVRETRAFHVRQDVSETFESELENAIAMLQEDGFEVVGISHAANVSYGEAYDLALYSAVVWGQRASDPDPARERD